MKMNSFRQGAEENTSSTYLCDYRNRYILKANAPVHFRWFAHLFGNGS